MIQAETKTAKQDWGRAFPRFRCLCVGKVEEIK